MTDNKARERTTEEMLDRLVGDADRAEVLLNEFEHSELGQRYLDVVRSWRQRWTYVVSHFGFFTATSEGDLHHQCD